MNDLKKNGFFFFALFLSLSAQSNYELKSEKDKQGNSYQSIKNDPTELRIYTLKNGLRVYLTPNKLEPTITARIAVKTGSNYDPADNTGLAHYLEHMMFKGTSKIGSLDWPKEKLILDQISDLYEKHKQAQDSTEKSAIYAQIDALSTKAVQYVNPNELPKLFQAIGAKNTNAYTWLEETVYVNTIPANQLKNFLQLEGERFKEVVLRLFHTELEAVYEEFNQNQDRDASKVNAALLAALFPTHPYGTQTTIGKAAHLKNPSMQAIHAYFSKYYVPNNMAIILSGDLNYEETLAWVKQYFETLPEKKDLVMPYFAPEKAMEKPIEKTVFGNSAASTTLAFRLPGISSKEALWADVLNHLLMEDAGIFNLNLNYPQKLQKIEADFFSLRDYSIHEIDATPKLGQELTALKALILEQIERIKKGDFDTTLLPAVTQKMKMEFYQSLKKDENRAGYLVQSFIQGKNWQTFLQDMEDIQNISPEELIDFVRKNYLENYAVIYKKIGSDTAIVKVKSPKITPILIKRDSPSEFFKEFTGQPAPKAINPVFVNYKDIKTEKLKNGLILVNNPDKSPFNQDVFSLTYLFDFGKKNDPSLALAFQYADFLGTEKYKVNDLKKELFKMGLSLDFSVTEDRAIIHLSGLKKSIEKGVLFLEEMIKTLQPDPEAYQNLVDNILQERENDKKDPNQILNHLLFWSIYGENSTLRNILSQKELQEKNPKELVDRLKNIFTYPHRIVYQGNEYAGVKKIVEMHHHLPKKKEKLPENKQYLEQNSTGKQYLVNYDKVQVSLIFTLRDRLIDPTYFAYTQLFNTYFGSGLSSVVFQEIREAKALAYRAGAVYQDAKEKNHYNILFAYVHTQADKLISASEAMQDLFKKIPRNLAQFEQAKSSIAAQIAAERIPTEKLFWNLETLKKIGIQKDIRKDIYAKIKTITWEEFEIFFTDIFKDKKMNQGIIGNISTLNLPENADKEEISLEQLFNY